MNILNNNSPIGFFDSGVGGLTVLKKVKMLMPDESFIFFGDTLHVPYGEKTKEQLLSYAEPILEFFERKNCKAVVMACNTTSSVIYDDINGRYDFKIYPVVQTVAKTIAQMDIDRLGVFATQATVRSGAYHKEISKYNPNMKVFQQYCSKWVAMVENNQLDVPQNIGFVQQDLEKMLSNNPNKIVLGCTHYPYLLPVLTKFAPSDLFIDPADYLAEFIKNDLTNSDLLSNSTERFEEFYVSSSPEKFKTAAKMFYEIAQTPELIEF